MSWSRTSLLMHAFTPSIRCLVSCAMALHKLIIHTTSSHSSAASWIVALCVSLRFSASELRQVIPFLVLGSYGSTGVLFPPRSGYSSPCIHSLDNSLYIAMPCERPRMGSRCGGSRGRAAPHLSSDALERWQSSPPVIGSGRGRGRGRAGRVDCEHVAHPTVRYRIPCSHANCTFIVSVTIEKCEDNRGSRAAHPRALTEQRMANPADNQRQVIGGASLANQAVCAGPSAPASGEPTGSAIHHSDSEDSLQFGCTVVEEPYTSEDD